MKAFLSAEGQPSRSPLWLSFCACCCCEIIAGQVSSFGLFSDLLRDKEGLALSQLDIETVAVSLNCGYYFKLVGGLVYDRWGSRFTLLIGLLMTSFGYLAIHAAVHAAAKPAFGSDVEETGIQNEASLDSWQPPLALLCACTFCFGQGAGWIETTVISTSLAHFPDEAVGLLKTFSGIAAAIGALVYAALLAPSRHALLVALAIGPLVIGVPSLLLVPSRGQQAAPCLRAAPWKAAYKLAFGVALFLSMYSLVASNTEMLQPYEDHHEANFVALGIVIGLLAILPMLPLLVDSVEEGGKQQAPELMVPAACVQDFSFVEVLCQLDFWLFFVAFAAGTGSGLMVLDNIGQLAESLDSGSSVLQPTCVTFFSIANAIGRLTIGHFASFGLFSRTRLFALVLALTAVAYAVFAIEQSRGGLLTALPILGFGYGCLWSLQPLIVSDLFGKRRGYGAKYATICSAAVIGSAPLCQFVVPHFYNAHADDSGWCVGPSCFQGSLAGAALMCGLGAVFALALDWSVSDKSPTAHHTQMLQVDFGFEEVDGI